MISLLVLSTACSVGPEPILYGEDDCAHCQMKIMDKRYGTEIVTDKGKVYKFDSVECLVEYLEQPGKSNEKFSLFLVTAFDQPGALVDANSSYYLRSKNLPSPMGMYLSAFKTKSDAEQFMQKYQGKVFDWNELVKNFDAIRMGGL